MRRHYPASTRVSETGQANGVHAWPSLSLAARGGSDSVRLSHLTEVLGGLPYVEDSVSLTSAEETVVAGSRSVTRDFLRVSDAPHTQAQLIELDKRIDDNPLVEGTLISSDRHTVGIVSPT